MKRTIFCVALILCMAIMAGCAMQAPDRVQSPISAQTELPQMRKADDAAEVVTALLPSQTVEENSKTEQQVFPTGNRLETMRRSPLRDNGTAGIKDVGACHCKCAAKEQCAHSHA